MIKIFLVVEVNKFSKPNRKDRQEDARFAKGIINNFLFVFFASALRSLR